MHPQPTANPPARPNKLVRTGDPQFEPRILPCSRRPGAGRGGFGNARPRARALPPVRGSLGAARRQGRAVRADERGRGAAQGGAAAGMPEVRLLTAVTIPRLSIFSSAVIAVI